MTPLRARAFAVPLAVTFTHQAVGSFFLLTAPVLASVLAERADLPSSMIGLFMSLAYIAAMVGSGLSGSLFARMGALTVSSICIGGSVVGLLMLNGTSAVLIALSAVVLGLTYGPLTPASTHVLAAHSPISWKNTILAIKQTGVPVGGTLAGLAMPFLVVAVGWGWALMVPAVVGAAVSLLLLPACRRIDGITPPPASASRRRSGSALSRSWLATLGTGAFCYAGVQMSLTTFLALYFVEHIGLTLAGAGLMIGIFQMSGLVARLVWGSLADRLGERVPLFAGIGLLIAVAVMVFLSLARPEAGYPTFIAATIVLGTICNSWTGLYFAEIVRAVPENEMGRATGLALMFTFAGVVIIPPSIGVAVSAAGFPAAFALIGALGGIGSVCGYIARRRSPGADVRK